MNNWSKRAASGTFAALTLAVVVGGGLVLAGAFLCIWILNAYPPGTAYPLAILACLLPAVAAAVGFVFLLKHHAEEPAAGAHPLLGILEVAGHAGRPMNGLIIASFVAGALMGVRATGAGHHRASPHS